MVIIPFTLASRKRENCHWKAVIVMRMFQCYIPVGHGAIECTLSLCIIVLNSDFSVYVSLTETEKNCHWKAHNSHGVIECTLSSASY